MAEKILEVSDGVPIDEAVETFLTERPDADERLRRFMRQLAMEGVTDLAQLTVALRQIRALVG